MNTRILTNGSKFVVDNTVYQSTFAGKMKLNKNQTKMTVYHRSCGGSGDVLRTDNDGDGGIMWQYEETFSSEDFIDHLKGHGYIKELEVKNG